MLDVNNILSKSLHDVSHAEIKACINPAMTDTMIVEWKVRDRGGIYGKISKELAYNSNRIEGSKLTEEETVSLFETQTILPTQDIYRPKDVEEMNGHFLMFNKLLQTIDEPLSETLIKTMHYELEAGVFEFRANGYIPGSYKLRKNTVSGIETTKPEDVEKEMEWLIECYNAKGVDGDLESLLAFHVRFERIHPFQDGNGRVGRALLFRESLRRGILPFIIHDENKAMYYKALSEWHFGNEIPFYELVEEEQLKMWNTVKEYLYVYDSGKDALEEIESAYQQVDERME